MSPTQGRKCVLSGYTMSWLKQEHRFWVYKPLREAINTFSPTMQDLLGYSEKGGGTFGPEEPGLRPPNYEEWDRSIFNAAYLMRSPEQVAADEGKSHQDVGNLGYDDSIYSGPFWAPPEETEGEGPYIKRLRERRKWTMSR